MTLFEQKGLTHLLETHSEKDLLSPMGVRLLLRRFVQTYPQVVVFQKGAEQVISVGRIRAVLKEESLTRVFGTSIRDQ